MTYSPPQQSLSILSLNCWGLKYVSKHRVSRLDEISNRIASSSYSLVCLQEFWVYSDYENLRRKTSSVLPYGKFYSSGVLGGGLAILSKYPIVESSMHKYSLNGRPTAFWRGDWYVGKGVACATVRLEDGTLVDVFNTHLHAPYEPHPHDTYLCHRTTQAWEISKLLRKSVLQGHISIACGDFNMVPNSLAHSLISSYGLVRDSWHSAFPSHPVIDLSPTRTAAYNLDVLGCTCDSLLNTWRNPNPAVTPPREVADPRGQRLDYVFHSPGNSTVTSARVGFVEGFREPESGKNISLSDHFSIEVELRIDAPSASSSDSTASSKLATRPKEKFLSISLLDEISTLTSQYYQREVAQSKYRILHFYLSVVVLVALHVSVWFWKTGGFLFVFLSWLVAVTGTIDGLVGFLFMYSEMAALREFEEEMRFYRAVVEREAKKASADGES